jgi:hypothetical protein
MAGTYALYAPRIAPSRSQNFSPKLLRLHHTVALLLQS